MFILQKFWKGTTFAAVVIFGTALLATAAPARRPVSHARPAAAAGGVYQQFRGPNNFVIRWLSEQMPVKVWIAPGTSLDSLIDPNIGAPYTSVNNRDHWPDLVASVVQNPGQLQSLPVAVGYAQEHYQAALNGINTWQHYSGGLYSYTLVNDPMEADIFVFWTNHFVDKSGMGLFQNDIRGYTAKRSFPYRMIQGGQIPAFKPVVTLLRTTDSAGNPMALDRMQASAAHEFGHALGIEGHSPNPHDLMSVYYGRGVISANDAATIKYLYKLNPDFVP